MRCFLVLAFFCFLLGCAGQVVNLQTLPSNPNADIGFFSENNLSQEMRLEYAAALQTAGLYNFKTENFSEEQIENGVEIRLNYREEKKVFILQAVFLKDGLITSTFTIKENSIKEKKKFRKKVLLEMFLEETKRTQFEKQSENNNV